MGRKINGVEREVKKRNITKNGVWLKREKKGGKKIHKKMLRRQSRLLLWCLDEWQRSECGENVVDDMLHCSNNHIFTTRKMRKEEENSKKIQKVQKVINMSYLQSVFLWVRVANTVAWERIGEKGSSREWVAWFLSRHLWQSCRDSPQTRTQTLASPFGNKSEKRHVKTIKNQRKKKKWNSKSTYNFPHDHPIAIYVRFLGVLFVIQDLRGSVAGRPTVRLCVCPILHFR